MKKIIIVIAAMLFAVAQPLAAKEGYHITLKMSGVKDSMVFLAHYYGKNRPKIFRTDSARFDKNGTAVFSSTDKDFQGGIYIMYLSDLQTNFEVLLNKGEDVTIIAPKDAIPDGIQFKNSPENTRFSDYIKYLKGYSENEEKLKKALERSTTAADTAAVRKDAVAASKELKQYRQNYVKNYPGSLLATIFSAIEMPQVPEGEHLLEDGKTKDSTFAYRYYKSHFWDGFNFRDDRLIYTPIYDARIEEYFSKLVVPATDSLEKEADILLAKTKGTKDMFHYTLWWLTQYVENSKVMGLDEVFVYLVENYYMKGDAFWLTHEELNKYIERARKIAPNVIGNIGPEVKQPNVATQKDESMLSLKAKYTVLVFYSPNCGHCQHELPLLDSVYEAVLKSKGAKVYTMATEGEDTVIRSFLSKIKVDKKWTNTWDPQHTSDCRDKYDVYSTPVIYLLDEKKIIRGKRLDHSNIAGLIDMLEKKQLSKP